MKAQRSNKTPRSPLKATQWAKRGVNVPRDLDGAYRATGRLDGRKAPDFKETIQ